MDSQEEQEDQEEEKPFEVEADAECFESSQDLVHEIFRVDGGRKFAGFTNSSVLYSHTYEISYQTACEDSCFTCAAQATYANRVKKDGKYMAVAGTGQDAFFLCSSRFWWGLSWPQSGGGDGGSHGSVASSRLFRSSRTRSL